MAKPGTDQAKAQAANAASVVRHLDKGLLLPLDGSPGGKGLPRG